MQGSGGAGLVTVYDRQTGAFVARFSGGPDSQTNDVALAPNGDAYVTNSFFPVLYRIPAAALDQAQQEVQALPVVLSWDGTPFEYLPDSVNANGIVVSPDGRFLLVVSFASGQLFRVRLSDREVTEVDLGGTSLTGGDGMVLTADRALCVVLAQTNEVVKLQMDATYTQGVLVSRTNGSDLPNPHHRSHRRTATTRRQQPVRRAWQTTVDCVEHPAALTSTAATQAMPAPALRSGPAASSC